MSKLYRGGIGRLVIFAGPSGSGKTEFLKKPSDRLRSDNTPPPIADFHSLAVRHTNIMDLRKVTKLRLENLCMHVDLTQPIRWLSQPPRNRKNLLNSIEPQMFSDWKELTNYCERASEIHVITFFVRREEHFRRWTGRALQKDPNGNLRRTVTAVNGDSSNQSELHRKVYSAWRDFVKMLTPQSNQVINGNEETYSFLSNEEFEAEINTGYKS